MEHCAVDATHPPPHFKQWKKSDKKPLPSFDHWQVFARHSQLNNECRLLAVTDGKLMITVSIIHYSYRVTVWFFGRYVAWRKTISQLLATGSIWIILCHSNLIKYVPYFMTCCSQFKQRVLKMKWRRGSYPHSQTSDSLIHLWLYGFNQLLW